MNQLFRFALWISLFIFAFKIRKITSIPPIIVLGNKLYNSKTGERFIMKGLTYEYAISDDYYTQYGETIFDENLKSIQGYYNTIRLYNINPDKSYSKFMKKMDSLGVYVLASGTPDNNAYFGDYRYAAMRKDLGPNDRTKTCYPAKLLEYGKKIAKNFAQYDNTLGIVMGNEIMQTDLIPAACVKQYISDLKNWMRSYAKRMRILPLAYAAADSAYTPDSLHVDADNYGPLKILGLLCGDVMKNGRMLSSIDVYLLNTYRWCGKSTYVAGFSRMVEWAQGLPIVIALGEFGCRQPADPPRQWEQIPYLVGSNTDGQNMTSIYSGGIAYSYGEANLGTDSLFPMFTGGSQALDGKPSMKKTVDYDNFAEQLQKSPIVKEVADWDSSKKCAWTPPITEKVAVSNKFVLQNNGWIADSCDKVVPGNGDKPVWSTTSRQGAACANDGSPCEVVVSSTYSTTEEQLCGVKIEANGGGKCANSNDCGKNGVCVLVDGIYTCQCLNDYSGPSCNIIDLDKRGSISSNDSAPKKIFIAAGSLLACALVFFTIIFIRSKALVAENEKFEKIVGKQSTGGQTQQTASL